jgi:hypothetical protein
LESLAVIVVPVTGLFDWIGRPARAVVSVAYPEEAE